MAMMLLWYADKLHLNLNTGAWPYGEIAGPVQALTSDYYVAEQHRLGVIPTSRIGVEYGYVE